MIVISYSSDISDVLYYLQNPTCTVVLRHTALFGLNDIARQCAACKVYAIDDDVYLYGVSELIEASSQVETISLQQFLKLCAKHAPTLTIGS